MHSIKNMVVAVCLLAVSFGLYQISLTPGSNEQRASEANPPASDEMMSESLPAPEPQAVQPLASNFPDLDLGDSQNRMPEPPSFNTKIQPPKLQPLADSNGTGVQKIDYPGTTPEPFEPESGNVGSTPKLAERELIDQPGDEGLIEALQQQNDFEASLNSPANGQTSDKSQYASQPTPSDSTPFSAQPIATNDSDFVGMDPGVATTGVDSASPMDFDTGVRQANREPDLDDLDFNAAIQKAGQLISLEQYQESLQLLSRFYHDEDLTGPQRQQLMGYLDALAGKVIFSEEDHLAPSPYIVAPNETLADIAARWKVPAQLIYNINSSRIPNPAMVAAGTELKEIRGPFRAEIDIPTNEMTLYLDDLYAGRFPVRIGISGEPKPGNFQVLIKSAIGHTWRDADGNDYPPDAAENGYGPHWIGLTGSLCIHAVDEATPNGHHGCIGLSEPDAKDVFAILAENSQVTIIR